MTNKVNFDEIDERLVIAGVRKDQIKQEIVPPPLVPLAATAVPATSSVKPEDTQDSSLPDVPKEESRRKRKQQDYETLFIKESNVTARLGKTVYIRKEFHDRILKIVQVIGDNNVSLFSYIDNIIAHHFDTFQEDIIHSYTCKNSNSIF